MKEERGEPWLILKRTPRDGDVLKGSGGGGRGEISCYSLTEKGGRTHSEGRKGGKEIL